MTPDAPALVTRRRTPMGLTRAVVKVLVLVVACALNVSRARMLQGSTGDDAWGGSARDDDGISLLCEHQCAQLNRTTVGCSSSHNATCGKCFPKYVGSDKPWTACSAGSDDYHDYYGGSDDYGPGHDSGPMGLQASLATGLSSLLVALMCLVTWRGWLDCCSKKRRLKSHRAFMEPSTTLWRCDVCFHSNSVLNRYCVLCQTEATEQTITIAVTRAQVDHTDDDVFYTRLESPRARVSTIRCSHISPAHATLTPEQTVAVSRLRWRRHMSKKSFRWIECDPEDVRKESKLQGTMVTAIMVSVLPSPSRIRPYVCCEVSSGIEWLPAGEVSFDAKMYRMWRGIQRVSMLNFDERLRWLQQQLLRLREPISNEKHTIHVHRHHILKQTIDIFLLTPCSTLRRPLRVDIIDEPGIDGGGILREWLQLLCAELFSESSEYFVRTSSTQSDGYWIRPSSTRRTDCDLQHYVFFGKILGKVLLEGLVMNFRLCIPMLKHLLGYPLSMEDIQYVDEQIYTSVLFIHDYGQVEDLSLNFAVANHELIPNGSNIAVTESNKASYLELVIKYYLIDSVEHEMRCIIEGLRSIIPDKILHVFDFKELDLVLSGQPHIDVIDWQTHSAVGMLLHHPENERMVIEWFWEIVKSLDQRGRSRLLQYVTGSAGLPVEGFSCLTSLDGNLQPFTIQLIETTPDTAMPYASTCFNRLDLPVYHTKEEMEEVLTMILSTDVTGFNRR